MRTTVSGSVRPSSQSRLTPVLLTRPTAVSQSRSLSVRRWRRSRAVLVRAASVKASLGPRVVLSTSGSAMPRFSPDFTSKAAAPAPGTDRTQQPLSSFAAASSASAQRETEAASVPSVKARSSRAAGACGSVSPARGRITKSAISEPEHRPSRKKRVQSSPAARTERAVKSAALLKRRCSSAAKSMGKPPFAEACP